MSPLFTAPRGVVRSSTCLFHQARRQAVSQSLYFTTSANYRYSPDSQSLGTANISWPGKQLSQPDDKPPGIGYRNPKFISELSERIGKCVMFGMTPTQIREAADISRILALEWRELLVGVDGYVTEKGKCGLWRHGVAWGDMDSMAHVNNVVYNRWAESSRTNYFHTLARTADLHSKWKWENLLNNSGIGLILKSIKVDFKYPVTWPDRVTVCHRVDFLSPNTQGPTDMHFQVAILSEKHKTIVARCEEVVSTYDYRIKRKVLVPRFLLEYFSRARRENQDTRAAAMVKRDELVQRITALEKATWDRQDAVEDMGSASST